MKKLLYGIVALIAKFHEAIMSLNDTHATSFTDKQLHFLVIGIVGMLLIFVIHPLFVYLVKKKRILFISWIYVFTVLIVLTFGIEIGQGITGTGSMEFADIMFGLVGFMAMFIVFALIRGLVLLLMRCIRGKYES